MKTQMMTGSEAHCTADNTDLSHAVEVLPGGEWLKVVDRKMPRRTEPGSYTPDWGSLKHVVIDQPTLRTLRFLVHALGRDENVLLEGETATSKTTMVNFLASLTNHEVVRVNLSTHSDPSELIGRFMPNPKRGLTLDELLPHCSALQPESQAIVQRAATGCRELDRVEQMQILQIEGWTMLGDQPWIWLDGPVPRAMRRGAWLLLDEVNLGGQALERLNSLLEDPRSLILNEGDGRIFGPHGDEPIHPDFRVIATMNPASYAGRATMSPAFRNRFSFTMVTAVPSEADYRHMLHRLCRGVAPMIEFGGMRVVGDVAGLPGWDEPLYADFMEEPGVQQVLDQLAAFHTKLISMATPETDGMALGDGRKEPYVFTRRDLLTAVDLLAEDRQLNPHRPLHDSVGTAVQTVYLERLSGTDDRRRVADLMEAMDLGQPARVSSQAVSENLRLKSLSLASTWQGLPGKLAASGLYQYAIGLEAGQSVELSTSPPEGSGNFDTVLRVCDEKGHQLAFDDDGGEGQLSRLSFRAAESGTYLVEVSALGSGGEYVLGYRSPEASPLSEVTVKSYWQTVEGEVGQDEAFEVTFECQPDTHYTFSTSRSHQGMCYHDWDSVIRLKSGDRELASDDDGGDGRSSLLRWSSGSHSGWITLVVEGYHGARGRFRLAYRAKRVSRKEAEPASSSGSARSDGAASGSVPMLDVASRWKYVRGRCTASGLVQTYRFRAERGQQIVLSTSRSTGAGQAMFDSVIDLYDGAGNLLASDDDGGEGTSSVLRHTLPSTGEYTVAVKPFLASEAAPEGLEGLIAPRDGGFKLAYRFETPTA